MQNKITLILLLTTLSLHGQKINPDDFEKLPSVQWRFKTRFPIFSSPVISEGKVFFAGLDSTVYALDLANGEVKWKLKTNGEIRSTVTVLNDRIYLVGGNGVLSCIDKNNGKPVWRVIFDNTALFLAERRYDFADYYHSSPLIHNNIIYFGSGTGKMNAFKADTGELLWSFKTGDIVHNTPVILKDKLYFGSYDGYVYALNILSGELVWKFKSIGQQYFPKGEMQGFPSAGNGMIYVGSRDFNLYALDANEGYANWNKKFQGGWALSTTVKDTVVYVGTSDDRVLLAYDGRNGQELWKTDVKFNIFGSCAVTPATVLVGTIWGKLYGIDRKSGAIRWGFATDGHAKNHDSYFKKDDAYREDIGRILRAPIDWIGAEYKMGGIFSTPAVAGDQVVITTTEGIVYCLKK